MKIINLTSSLATIGMMLIVIAIAYNLVIQSSIFDDTNLTQMAAVQTFVNNITETAFVFTATATSTATDTPTSDSLSSEICSDGTRFDNFNVPCAHDEDNDGIHDDYDLCPSVGDQDVGVDNNGCPLVPTNTVTPTTKPTDTATNTATFIATNTPTVPATDTPTLTATATNTQPRIVIPIECGDIRLEELTAENNIHEFDLNVSAGTFLNIIIEPIGNSLNPYMVLYDSSLNEILRLNSEHAGQIEQLTDYQISSSIPRIHLFGTVPNFNSTNGRQERGRSLGAYTLQVSCILRDGTIINPGDTIPQINITPNATQPTFSGFGFPGLASVDFTNVAAFPIESGAVMQGGITPAGGEIVGYTIAANAGDIVDLSFIRGGGNLNLGLIMLSQNNELVYQASLITSQVMSTRLTLPSQGTYTIGVFRIDLLPPAEPQATAFQIRVVLNPE